MATERLAEQLITFSGSGSLENAGSFKIVAMEKETQASIMHKQRL